MSVFTRMSSEKRAKLLNEQRFTSSRKGEVGKRIVAAKMMATVALRGHVLVILVSTVFKALIYIQASKTTSTKGTDLLKELTGTDTSRS
ncbi:unnamed protein product [Alternaria alternata]